MRLSGVWITRERVQFRALFHAYFNARFSDTHYAKTSFCGLFLN
jgi:hypothetical protein